ncbi:uncharacterized protein LOC113762994 isoform X1 [Coffea eugenioides]|uniref:uncharacterized protein LOC113762994 isoform X1 n=1 Tax=Coffea eugenioides TaxID=49369 RepID=UPI000F606423|nr:uncharacterized protein LOC113762994 isoform X1 [Coffea eugenioides]XP_027162468.1 uncharacterized protein LOC113762994 isoform X1 [Coffea eugenioides]
MAKKRGRKPAKQKESNIENVDKEEAVPEKSEKNEFQDEEVEHQIAAIRALRHMEIEQLRTMLHLLRSCFSKEQLQVPLLQFFKENFPNLSIVKNEKNGIYEVQQKDDKGNLYTNQANGGNLHASLLHRLSMTYPDFSTVKPSLGDFEFSNKSGKLKASFLGVDCMQIRGFDLEELSDATIFERQDKFRTPDVNNQRLSVGLTPKTKRLPKHGEMLLSVHGSPLGVYKEDNMEAIDEMEDG